MAAPRESYEIKPITTQDLDIVLQFLQQFFYTDEPLNVCLDRERTETVDSDRGLSSAGCITEGLSLMAITPDNEIVGIAINRLFTSDFEHHKINTELHPNSVEISSLVVQLEELIAETAKLQHEDENELSVRVISVHPAWRGKGIASALLETTRQIAKREGFSQIRGICTSAFSAKAFEKLGYQLVGAIKYEDYQRDGNVIFKPDFPHTHIKAMILRI